MQHTMTYNRRKQICTTWNKAVYALAALHGLAQHKEVNGFVEQACDGLLDRRCVVLARAGYSRGERSDKEA
jgi:hypothetical protein